MVLLTWREKTTRLLCDTVSRVDKDIVATAHPVKHKSKLLSINQYFNKFYFMPSFYLQPFKYFSKSTGLAVNKLYHRAQEEFGLL